MLAADVQDRDGALPLIEAGLAKYPTITKIFADSAYAGRCATEVHARHPKVEIDVARHPANRTVGVRSDGSVPPPTLGTSRLFVPLPKRWVVERTHAWVERPRRMAKDNDRTTTSSTAWIWFTQARILMRRLTWIQGAELTT